MSKIKLSSIVGIRTFEGHNHRNPFEHLGLNEVTFRSELAAPEPPKEDGGAEIIDGRTVLSELVFGDNATDETKKDFINRMRQEPALWGSAQNVLKVGQLQPIVVVHEAGGKYSIVAGHRRYLFCLLAHLLAPEIAPDTINAETTEVAEVEKLNTMAVSENQQRKSLSAVELGKVAARLNAKDGMNMSYKDIALTLNIMQKGAKGKPPTPATQTVRNCALLWNPAVTDKDREQIVNGEAGYTKVLQKRGLAKSGAVATERSEDAVPSVRKRSLSLKELTEIFDSPKKLEKIVETCMEKTGSNKVTVETVRYLLMKVAGQVKYKPLPEEKPEAEEAA